jgi:hypothetical protein
MAALAAFACPLAGCDAALTAVLAAVAVAAVAGEAAADDELAATAELAAAPDGAEAPAASEAAIAAPVASSAGIVSTDPSLSRLGSCDINAFGFASNKAFEARASVARSCDCVAAIATSFSDCPG